MKKTFFYIFIYLLAFTAPGVFADDTSSNSDFNPFPQMEQDLSPAEQDSAPSSGPQNAQSDAWPPAGEVTTNSGGDNG